MAVLRTLKAVVLMPVWILQLATTAKSFLDHPLIGSRRLNRMGLPRARVRIADGLCRWRRSRLARHVPREWVEAFERDDYGNVYVGMYGTLREAMNHARDGYRIFGAW